jgi:hypothetical protein
MTIEQMLQNLQVMAKNNSPQPLSVTKQINKNKK